MHQYPTEQQRVPNQEQGHNVITTKDKDNIPEQTPIAIGSTLGQYDNQPRHGASMEYRHLLKSWKHCMAWTTSFANEVGRLAQGVGGRNKGTNTVYYIGHDQVPVDRQKKGTYKQICVDY
jgi:hypothetical protein